ncbi:MAG: winged helix-turn-helix domain-containing protein [Hyphomonas sp.]|nr:winged helix-turn-helix domain-containing protein [Hyphomonas sp.]
MGSQSASGDSQYKYVFGNVVFDERAMTLEVDGVAVDVERRPLELLSLLLSHVDEVMTKDELLDTVWAGQTTVENVLPNAINKLRRVLGEANADRIVTHPRIGYRFSGPVERTATGRKLQSSFSFASGQAIPKREHFRLQDLLSSGPGREVWAASHAKTGEQRVFKFARDGEALTSLKREVTIQRLLYASGKDGAATTRIMDWNFSDPPFFIECEHGGSNLKDWLEQDGRIERMPLSERIGLVARIARAVDQFHQVGILHKDLKPTNILVSGNGADVRLIDFGSGTVLERERLEAAGLTPMGLTQDPENSSRFATAGYIAPELVKGQASSVRSDIYALGLIAWQVLSGEIGAALTTDWDTRIDDPLLTADILAATHPDPEQRMASAGLLAERLETLDERRSKAEEDTREAERLQKADAALRRARARRPWLVATMGLLLLGIASSSAFAFQANQARKTAERQSARAVAANSFLTELVVSANPNSLGHPGDSQLQAAIDRSYEKVSDQFSGDPLTQIDLMESLLDLFAGLGDYGKSAEVAGDAADILHAVNKKTTPREIDLRFARIRNLGYNQQIDEAKAELDELAETESDLLHASPLMTLKLLRTEGLLGLHGTDCESGLGQLEEANRIYMDNDINDLQELAEIKSALAQCYSRLNRDEDALREARALNSPLLMEAQGLQVWRKIAFREILGGSLAYSMRFSEARPVFHELLKDVEGLYGPNSRQAGQIHTNLAQSYSGDHLWGEARDHADAASRIICELVGEDNGQCMTAQVNAAIAAIEFGEGGEAEAVLQRVRDTFVELVGPDHPAVKVIEYHILRCMLFRDAPPDAMGRLIDGFDPEVLEQASPGNHWQTRIDGIRGRYLVRAGKTAEGKSLLTNAIAAMRLQEFPEDFIARYEADL